MSLWPESLWGSQVPALSPVTANMVAAAAET
jgi:hypothetical protein